MPSDKKLGRVKPIFMPSLDLETNEMKSPLSIYSGIFFCLSLSLGSSQFRYKTISREINQGKGGGIKEFPCAKYIDSKAK